VPIDATISFEALAYRHPAQEPHAQVRAARQSAG
jgi:hypothetical protein